jgi:hypothetical protein
MKVRLGVLIDAKQHMCAGHTLAPDMTDFDRLVIGAAGDDRTQPTLDKAHFVCGLVLVHQGVSKRQIDGSHRGRQSIERIGRNDSQQRV